MNMLDLNIRMYYYYLLLSLWFMSFIIWGPHKPTPPPQIRFESIYIQIAVNKLSLCVLNKCLHLTNPDLGVLNGAWWGWGGFVWSP